MAEHMSSETKMRDRIDYLESKLTKYAINTDESTMEKDEWVDVHDDHGVNEEQIDVERQKLLQYQPSDSDTD